MAGMVGMLVAGGVLRQRALGAASGAAHRQEPAPPGAADRMTAPPDKRPAWSLDDEARQSSGARPVRELASALDSWGEDASDPHLEPRVRRGPSGREHFWMEPWPPVGG